LNKVTSFIRRQALPLFCALTIALSFAATLLPLPGEAVPVVMVFIPALIALSLTAVTDGWMGVRALLSKRGQWRVRPLWVVVAVVLGLVLRVIMSVIALLLGQIPFIQLRQWSPMQLGLFAVMLFVFAIPEELGWRGYAFPKLLKAHSPLIASLLVGVLWGSLHLALTLPGMVYAGAPLLAFVLEVAGLAVLGTWLYIRTGGNLLITSLFHAAQSFFVIVNDGIALEQQLWLMAGVFLSMALIIVLIEVSRFTRKTGQPFDGVLAAYVPPLRPFDR
jgi:membrane protease YdiL (CAAX protease family)